MEGLKLFRSEDEIVVCKTCHAVVSIGYNILQEEEYEIFTAQCKEQSLCPSCLKKSRIDSIINNHKVLLKTVENMLAVGVL